MIPTVLVVDDDDAIREITQVALELVAGWEVLDGRGGREALARRRRAPPGRRAARPDDARHGRAHDLPAPAGGPRHPGRPGDPA